MKFQYIGNNRYKIYLDRIPARSIRLTSNEINEISEFNLEHLDDVAETAMIQEYYDDVLGDIEEQCAVIRELQEVVTGIKNDNLREKLEAIIVDLDTLGGHL